MKTSYFSPDTREFLQLLFKHQVEYMIVGGEAVIYYGYPRLTGDVDFFYKNDDKNVQSLFDTLLEFWENDIPGLKKWEDLRTPGYIIQFGIPPNRIDLLNRIEGVKFNDAWQERNIEKITIGKQSIPINFIGLSHLIINKRAAGRSKDLEDLNYLESI